MNVENSNVECPLKTLRTISWEKNTKYLIDVQQENVFLFSKNGLMAIDGVNTDLKIYSLNQESISGLHFNPNRSVLAIVKEHIFFINFGRTHSISDEYECKSLDNIQRMCWLTNSEFAIFNKNGIQVCLCQAAKKQINLMQLTKVHSLCNIWTVPILCTLVSHEIQLYRFNQGRFKSIEAKLEKLNKDGIERFRHIQLINIYEEIYLFIPDIYSGGGELRFEIFRVTSNSLQYDCDVTIQCTGSVSMTVVDNLIIMLSKSLSVYEFKNGKINLLNVFQANSLPIGCVMMPSGMILSQNHLFKKCIDLRVCLPVDNYDALNFLLNRSCSDIEKHELLHDKFTKCLQSSENENARINLFSTLLKFDQIQLVREIVKDNKLNLLSCISAFINVGCEPDKVIVENLIKLIPSLERDVLLKWPHLADLCNDLSLKLYLLDVQGKTMEIHKELIENGYNEADIRYKLSINNSFPFQKVKNNSK